MYLGELTRILIVDAIEKGVLNLPLSVFKTPRVFDTKHISAIEDDPRSDQPDGNFISMDEVLLDVGISKSQLAHIADFDKQALR